MPKKKKNSSLTYSPESVREVKKKLKALNKKRVLTLFLSTLAAFTVYEALLSYEASIGVEFSVTMLIMFSIVTILAGAVILLNHGFSKKDFTPDMLRKDISKEEAVELCAKLNRHRLIAKKLMMVLTPLMLAMLLDIVWLFYGDTLKTILSFLSPNQ